MLWNAALFIRQSAGDWELNSEHRVNDVCYAAVHAGIQELSAACRLVAGRDDRQQYLGVRASHGPAGACAAVSLDSAHLDDVISRAPALLGRRVCRRQQDTTWLVV